MSDGLLQAVESAAAKVAAPAMVVAASVGGLSVAEWMYIATIAYVVIQSGYLLWKWRREWLAGRDK